MGGKQEEKAKERKRDLKLESSQTLKQEIKENPFI